MKEVINVITGSIQAKKGYYYAVIRLNPSAKPKWHRTGIKTDEKRAKERATKIMYDIIREYESKQMLFTSEVLFTDFMLGWLESRVMLVDNRKISNGICLETYKEQVKRAENSIIPFFKDKKIKLQDLTQHHLDEYYQSLINRGCSGNTVKHHHSDIHNCLEEAVYKDLVSMNVANKTKSELRTPVKPRYTWYNKQQLDKLLRAVKGMADESIIRLACYGLRRGEIGGLMWSNVDMENRLIYLKVARTKYRQQRSWLKTETSTRLLPMNEELHLFLQQLKVQQEADRAFYGNAYIENDFVCKRSNGELFKLDYMTRCVKKYFELANLTPIRFHDLRHSCASKLHKDGVDMKNIQNWLGHANVRTTADTYTHTDVDSLVAVAAKISC